MNEPGNINRRETNSEGEAAPTTSLLKKMKPASTEGEPVPTAPLTSRLVALAKEEEAEEKKKTSKGLFLGLGIVVVVIAVAFSGYLLLSKNRSSLFGGGSGIDSAGYDANSANIVEGGAGRTQGGKSQPPAGTTAPARGTQTPATTVTEPTPAPVPAASTAAPPPAATRTEPAPVPPASKPEPPKEVKTASASASAPQPTPAKTITPDAPAMSVQDQGSATQGFNTSQQAAAVKEGDTVPLDPDVTPPEIVKQISPQMPFLALQLRKKDGVAAVSLLIDHRGNVEKAILISEKPLNFGFGKAAIEAALQWKFKPARKNNVNVKCWKMQTFRFK